MTKETFDALYEVMDTLDEQRERVEADMEEYSNYEDYTLDEQRYDEGYANALRWASLTIGKMLFGEW